MSEDWYKFDNGTKSSSDIDTFAYVLENTEQKYISRFLKEVKNEALIDKQIDDVINLALKAEMEKIVRFILDKTEDTGKTRTAVTQCNFADVGDNIRRLSSLLKGSTHIIRIASTGSLVSSVIDEVKSSKKSVLIIIEQSERLSRDYSERLFRLLHWLGQRSILSHPVAVLVCVSTELGAFSSMFSLKTLRMIHAETFNLSTTAAMYDSVLNAINHWEIGLFCSGTLLSSLRNQFFCCNRSIREVKRLINLAILEHNIVNEKWYNRKAESEDFASCRENYWKLLSFVLTEILSGKITKARLHEKIQNEKEFWSAKSSFEDWKSSLLMMSVEDLQRIIDRLSEKLANTNEIRIQQAYEKLQLAETSYVTPAIDVKETPVQKTPKSMSYADFVKNNKEAMNRKSNNPVAMAKKNLVTVIHEVFVDVLRRWEEFRGSHYFLLQSDPAHDLLSTNPGQHIEVALAENSRTNLSMAYSSLMELDSWKTAHVSEWGSHFETKTKHMKPEAKRNACPAFFCSLGQLEIIGVVKCAPERLKGQVQVLYQATINGN